MTNANKIQLQKEIGELKAKLKHIKMVGYGNADEIYTAIDQCYADKIFSLNDLKRVVDDVVEKTDNLCLMCDSVNFYVKYEAALKQIANKRHFLEHNVSKDFQYLQELSSAVHLAEQALSTPTAEQAVKKADKEFHTFTRKKISEMDSKTFEENEKEIFEQLSKGEINE